MKTRLAAIINVWDGIELLKGSIDCYFDHVDEIIIVWQAVSNIGEAYDPIPDMPFLNELKYKRKIIMSRYEPDFNKPASQNEVKKRNIGLDIAINRSCTHFFHVDVDEYFEDFGAMKKEFLNSDHRGSVCRIYTYFKTPTLRLENLDGYYVPFIHELEEGTHAGNSSYPYYCDPTRTIHNGDVMHKDEIWPMLQPMHHYSWVRKDIGRKARNSSAAQYGNKLKGLLDDYHSPNLGKGYILKDMGGQRLTTVENIFGIEV